MAPAINRCIKDILKVMVATCLLVHLQTKVGVAILLSTVCLVLINTLVKSKVPHQLQEVRDLVR